MSSKFERLVHSHGAMLCAMTICALFLCAASVYSKQAPAEAKIAAAVDPFALKNPNAFDPARRRSVRAMKVPRETASHMASGIDTAEHEKPDAGFAETGQHSSPLVADAGR